MSGFQYSSIPPQFGLFPSYYTLDENGQPVIQTTAYMQGGGMAPFAPQSADTMTSGYDFDDQTRAMAPASGASRSRRRVGAAGEHVKFRRTRSGCYTCRNRRVKCDEARPICERCKKGNRDCVYPEPTTLTKTRRSSAKDKSAQDDGSSSDSPGGADLDEEILLMSSVSGSTDQDFSTASPVSDVSTPALTQRSGSQDINSDVQGVDNSLRPSVSRASSQTAKPRSMSAEAFSKLPEDIQFYIRYARFNMTPYHWNYVPDGSNFQRTSLLEAAIRYEPLLYAVTCFAAYHHTLHRPDGRMEHFLNYHSKSVLALSKALMKGQGKTLATLLTILQLATIEEALGDWVNLMSHQKAAYSILMELYSPETVMRHPTLRNVFKWYLHFDTYVGMLSGAPQVIGREWLEAQHNWYSQEVERSPENVVLQYERTMANTKLISYDIFDLFSKVNSGVLSEADAIEQLGRFKDFLETFEDNIPPCLVNPDNLIRDFSGAPPRDPVDITDPYEPNVIYGGENFPTNQYVLGTLGLKNVFEARLSALTGIPRTDDTAQTLVRRAIKVINAVHRWPEAPTGAILSFRAIFSLVSFLIPAKEREIMWMRTIFASVESSGYIYSDSIRSRLQALWNVDLSHWWLPNQEKMPPVIRSIREFIAERSRMHKDDQSTNLREMKGIFDKLSLTVSEASSPESPESFHSPGSSSNIRPSSDKRSPADD